MRLKVVYAPESIVSQPEDTASMRYSQGIASQWSHLYNTLRRNVFVFGVRRLNFSGEAFACSTSLYHVFSFWWFAYSLTFSPNSPHSYRASTFVFYVNFTIGLSMFVFVVGLCISLKMLTGNFLDRSPLLFPTVPST